jgi:hypothetical protein
VLKNKHQAVSQGVRRFGKCSPPAADEHLQKPHNAGSRPPAQFFNALLKPSAAMRAKRVTGWHVLAAEAACLDLALNRGCRFRAGLGDGPLAPVAHDDRLAGLDF